MKFEKSESLDMYFDSIQNLNPLEKKEELELARRIKKGDQFAINKLIKHNLKIVVKIANKNRGRGIDVEDLIQQGNIGLYEAALRFDPEQNVRFATFACTRILKSMNKLIDDCGRVVRIPVNQEYQRYLDKKNGKDVDNINVVRLDDFIGSEEDGNTIGSKLGSTRPEIECDHDMEHFKTKVNILLSSLKERDRDVLKLYYGIDQDEEMKTQDIAKEMGLTQIRICQIINSAKKRLQDTLV